MEKDIDGALISANTEREQSFRRRTDTLHLRNYSHCLSVSMTLQQTNTVYESNDSTDAKVSINNEQRYGYEWSKFCSQNGFDP